MKEQIFLVLIESTNGTPFSLVWIEESRKKVESMLKLSRFNSDCFVVKEIRESPRFCDDPKNSKEKEFFEIVGQENAGCGDCSECCNGVWRIELIDWETDTGLQVDSKRCLLKNESGDVCVYCNNGCNVYDKRPAVCKVFKCTVAYLIGKNLSDSIQKKAIQKLKEVGYFD